MKFLVTGGAGFIGSNFLQRFVREFPEHYFVNIDCLTYASNPLNLEGLDKRRNYRFELIDIRDIDRLDVAITALNPDVIVHFAAATHVDRSIEDPEEFIETNICGTFNILRVLNKISGRQPFRKPLLHHVSTDEVYGSTSGEPFVETTRYDPSSPYSASKAAADHLVGAYARTYGLRTRITNCSNNYGPRQFPEKLIPLMTLNALRGKPLPVYGDGSNIRDWLHVSDHCEAIWEVIRSGKDGETYNVGGNCEKTNVEIVTDICRVIAKIKSCKVSEFTKLITYVPDRPGHDWRYSINSEKIFRECNWRPEEKFSTGLEKTIRWYIENPQWVESIESGKYAKWIKRHYENG